MAESKDKDKNTTQNSKASGKDTSQDASAANHAERLETPKVDLRIASSGVFGPSFSLKETFKKWFG